MQEDSIISLETEFHIATLKSQSELYGWELRQNETLGLPTLEVYELFMTGVPVKVGVMQFTGEAGWALYSYHSLFKNIEELLGIFKFEYFWDGPDPGT